MHGTYNTDGMDGQRSRGGDRQRAYSRALAHSGRVRFAKVALPVIAVVGLVGLIGYTWVSRAVPSVAIDLSGSAIRDGKLVMANPKLDGFTSDGRPYSMRAARAVQDLTGSGVIDLERIQATAPLEDGVEARVLAEAGTYDSEAETLDISRSLSVETTDGKRADLGSASIDLATGSLATDEPLRISMPGAVLEAQSLLVEDNGKRLLFERNVKLVVQPGAFESALRESGSDAGSGG